MANPLFQVREGMNVMDHAGEKIGTVGRLKMTDEIPDTEAAEQVTADPARDRRDTIVDNIVDVFRSDGVPEEMYEHLLRTGFLRIDAHGLLASERYVTPDQIAEVAGENVILKVGREQLIRPV